MSQKKCADEHCDTIIEAKGRMKFCDLHRGTKAPKSPKPKRAPKSESTEAEVMAYPINLTEAQLDRFWSNMTLTDKGWAVQAVLDSQDA